MGSFRAALTVLVLAMLAATTAHGATPGWQEHRFFEDSTTQWVTSLAADALPGAAPMVAFLDPAERTIYVAVGPEVESDFIPVLTLAERPNGPRMFAAVAPSGALHLFLHASRLESQEYILHISNETGTWRAESAYEGTMATRFIPWAVGVAANDSPRILGSHLGFNAFLTRSGGEWVMSLTDLAGGIPDMDVSPDGRTHACFVNHEGITYLRDEGNGLWSRTLLLAKPFGASGCAMKADSSGATHVVFDAFSGGGLLEQNTRQVYHAVLENAALTALSTLPLTSLPPDFVELDVEADASDRLSVVVSGSDYTPVLLVKRSTEWTQEAVPNLAAARNVPKLAPAPELATVLVNWDGIQMWTWNSP